MAVHVVVRATAGGERRYLVRFRAGGREARLRHAGSFRTRREAEVRAQWVAGELAAGRLPDLALDAEPVRVATLREVAARWQESRQDVAENTRGVHRKALAHILPRFGDVSPGMIAWQDVAEWLGGLGEKYTRGTCAKALGVLRQVLDYADVQPNPARDRRVRLKREERRAVTPPNAAETMVLITKAGRRYRLPLLVLEATGMRVGELETLTWGDVDEPNHRWRIRAEVNKTRTARWVPVRRDVFDLVAGLVPREDRDLGGLVFPGVTQVRLRTDMARTCRAAGMPLYSPHDLRHRRISVRHMAGDPWALIGRDVGQADLATTANVYTHVITDGELDYRAVVPALSTV